MTPTSREFPSATLNAVESTRKLLIQITHDPHWDKISSSLAEGVIDVLEQMNRGRIGGRLIDYNIQDINDYFQIHLKPLLESPDSYQLPEDIRDTLLDIKPYFENLPTFGNLGKYLSSTFKDVLPPHLYSKQVETSFIIALGYFIHQLKKPVAPPSPVTDVGSQTIRLSMGLIEDIQGVPEHAKKTLMLPLGSLHNPHINTLTKRISRNILDLLADYEGLLLGLSGGEFVLYNALRGTVDREKQSPEDTTATFFPYLRGKVFFEAFEEVLLEEVLLNIRESRSNNYADVDVENTTEALRFGLQYPGILNIETLQILKHLSAQENSHFWTILIGRLWERLESDFQKDPKIEITENHKETCLQILSKEVRLIFDHLYHTNDGKTFKKDVETLDVNNWLSFPRDAFLHALDASIANMITLGNQLQACRILHISHQDLITRETQYKAEKDAQEKALIEDWGLGEESLNQQARAHLRSGPSVFYETLMNEQQIQQMRALMYPQIGSIKSVFRDSRESFPIHLSLIDVEYINEIVNDERFFGKFRANFLEQNIESLTRESTRYNPKTVFGELLLSPEIQTVIKTYILENILEYSRLISQPQRK